MQLPSLKSALLSSQLDRGFLPYIERLRSPLHVKSYHLMGSAVASAVFGFLFWAFAARATSPATIGVATAAIASATLLISLSDLGLGTTVIYFVARRGHNMRLLNTAVALGWLSSFLVSVGFLAGAPLWARGLIALRDSFLLGVIFVAFTMMTYLLTLHDATMLSQQHSAFVFWRNIACNAPPILLLFPMIGLTGSQAAPFLAFCLPNILVGLVSSLFIMPHYAPGYRLFGRMNLAALTEVANYSLASHFSNLIWGSIGYALPIIAINTLSATEAGYFYVCWTFANFLLIVPRTVASALFVEGARDQDRLGSNALRAFTLILLITLPLILGLWLFGHLLLGIFGKDYINTALMRPMLVSTIPFTINGIAFTYLRAKQQLPQLVAFSAVVALTVISSTVLLTSRLGLMGLSLGWLIGHLTIALGIIGFIVLRRLIFYFSRKTL